MKTKIPNAIIVTTREELKEAFKKHIRKANIIYIDLEPIFKQGDLTRHKLEVLNLKNKARIDYERKVIGCTIFMKQKYAERKRL